MAGPFVRTLTGDMAPEALGHCQCHEHLLISRESVPAFTAPEQCIDDPANSCRELEDYRAAGGGGLVDCQPVGCGRMAGELAEISRRSGVHIIASTGFHKLDYYPPGHFVHTFSAQRLAELFCAELTRGLLPGDPHTEADFGMPLKARAGIIKAASDGRDLDGGDSVSQTYRKLFLAAGRAAVATGAPVITHLEGGMGAAGQLAVLGEAGLPPSRVIFSHLDRAVARAPWEQLLETARSGAFLQLDTIARPKYHDDDTEARFVRRLVEEGLEHRILLGLDTTRLRLRTYGAAMGLDYILRSFRGTLARHGVGEEMFHRFAVLNPKAALRFGAAKE